MKKRTYTKLVRPLHDVFRYVDMKGGDKLQCWPWKGFLQTHQNGRKYPIFCWNNKRLQAKRVVYALKHGRLPDSIPQITMTCGTENCCNPDHMIERFSTHAKVKAA